MPALRGMGEPKGEYLPALQKRRQRGKAQSKAGFVSAMTTVTFDTLELVDKLKSANFSQEQAEAVVRVIADAQTAIVTRAYLDAKFQQELEPLKIDLAVLKSDSTTVKWMLGFLIACALSVVVKTFF